MIMNSLVRIADRVGYANTTVIIEKRIIPIKKMLNSLIKSKKSF